ncbi:MAG: metallophosphoesterase [Nitrososphaerota archaeon]
MLRPTGRPAVTIDVGSTRYLVVADLHVGYELELSAKGVRVPPHEERIASELVRLGEETGAQVLVLLGDVKHRVAGYSWRDAVGVRKLVGIVKASFEEVLVLPGNHDGGISELLAGLARIEDSRGIMLGDYWVMHGHTWPHPDCLSARTVVIGHTHPTLRIRSEEGTVRARVHLLMEASRSRLAKELTSRPGYARLLEGRKPRGKLRLVVLAHFSPLAPGVDVQELRGSPGTSPLIRSGVFDLSGAEVITLDAQPIGRLGEIRAEAAEG